MLYLLTLKPIRNVSDSRLIDLDALFESKFGKGKVPKWAIKLLKKILRVDFMNGCLAHGDEGVDMCVYAMEYLDVKLEISGLENIPSDGTRYTFASNHPLGGIDGVALAGIIGKNFGDMIMPVNDFLMALPALRPLCVPINKVGGQARNLPKLISEAFASEKQVLIFPAGICSRKIDGKVQDLPWSKTFITKSVENGRPIVPVHFVGQNSKRFYRVANLRKKLHIKFNIAMPLLPDEMYKSQHKTFKVIFGKPIPASTFDKSKTPAEWAAWVRETVYNL